MARHIASKLPLAAAAFWLGACACNPTPRRGTAHVDAMPLRDELGRIGKLRLARIDALDEYIAVRARSPAVRWDAGYLFVDEDNKIVGGEAFADWPAIGAVLRGSRVHCTATLIAPSLVLTAGHCFAGYEPSKLEFAVGPDARHPLRRYRVLRGALHDDYAPSPPGTNDLALLLLGADPQTDDPEVVPIPVPAVDLSSELRNLLRFVGYGFALKPSGSKYKLGRKASVDIPVGRVFERTFSYNHPGKSTCNGDSGGPAVLMEADRPLIVGITSWGDETCTSFGVSMRSDFYRGWIAEASALLTSGH